LGVIYKEKFKENELAIERFKKVLEFENVDEKLILPSKYNLYLAYKNLEDEVNAEIWRQNIIQEHPDSRYADILLTQEVSVMEKIVLVKSMRDYTGNFKNRS